MLEILNILNWPEIRFSEIVSKFSTPTCETMVQEFIPFKVSADHPIWSWKYRCQSSRDVLSHPAMIRGATDNTSVNERHPTPSLRPTNSHYPLLRSEPLYPMRMASTPISHLCHQLCC